MALRAICAHCKQELVPLSPEAKDHWKTCAEHPAKHEIDYLLAGLKKAAQRFRFIDRDGQELWSDAAEDIETFYLERWHDGTKRL